MQAQIQQLIANPIQAIQRGEYYEKTLQNKRTQNAVVNIFSKEPVLNLNIKGLIPNYFNVGNEPNIYIQIKQFQIHPHSVELNNQDIDSIIFRCTIRYLDNNTQQYFDHTHLTTTPIYLAGKGGFGCKNSSEYLYYWNQVIQDKVIFYHNQIQNLDPGQQHYLSDDQIIYGCVLKHVQLFYSSTTGKAALQHDFQNFTIPYPPESIPVFSVLTTAFYLANYTVQKISFIQIYPNTNDPALSEDDISRIKSLFGYDQNIDYDGFVIEYDSYINAININPNNIPAIFNKEVFQISYSTVMSKANPVDFILIRSSLTGMSFNQNGIQDDILEVITIEQGLQEIGRSRVVNQDRTYQIKTSYGQIMNIQLRFTRTNGKLINFLDQYYLQIAIFIE